MGNSHFPLQRNRPKPAPRKSTLRIHLETRNIHLSRKPKPAVSTTARPARHFSSSDFADPRIKHFLPTALTTLLPYYFSAWPHCIHAMRACLAGLNELLRHVRLPTVLPRQSIPTRTSLEILMHSFAHDTTFTSIPVNAAPSTTTQLVPSIVPIANHRSCERVVVHSHPHRVGLGRPRVWLV